MLSKWVKFPNFILSARTNAYLKYGKHSTLYWKCLFYPRTCNINTDYDNVVRIIGRMFLSGTICAVEAHNFTELKE